MASAVKHFYVGIKGLIMRPDGKMLLLRPKESKHPFFIGGWDMPGGRILKHSEGEERLRSKIKEETGLTHISSIEPFGGTIIDQAVFTEDDVSVGLVLLVYICRVDERVNLITIDEDHSGYEWFSPREAAEKLYQFPDDFRRQLRSLKPRPLKKAKRRC